MVSRCLFCQDAKRLTLLLCVLAFGCQVGVAKQGHPTRQLHVSVADLIDPAQQTVDDLLQQGQQIFDNVTNAVNDETATNLTQGVLDDVNDFIDNLFNNITNIISPLVENITTIDISAIRDDFNQAINNALGSVIAVGDGVAETTVELSQKLVGTAVTLFEVVSYWAENMVNETISDVASFIRKLDEATEEQRQQLVDDMQPAVDAVVNTMQQGLAYLTAGLAAISSTGQLAEEHVEVIQSHLSELLQDTADLYDTSVEQLKDLELRRFNITVLQDMVEDNTQLATAAAMAAIGKGYVLITQATTEMLTATDLTGFSILTGIQDSSLLLDDMFRVADDSRRAILSLQSMTLDEAYPYPEFVGRRRLLQNEGVEGVIEFTGFGENATCEIDWMDIDIDNLRDLNRVLECSWSGIWMNLDSLLAAGSAVVASLIGLVQGVWNAITYQTSCNYRQTMSPDLMESLSTSGFLTPCGDGGCWKCMQAGFQDTDDAVVASICRLLPRSVFEQQQFVFLNATSGGTTAFQIQNENSGECLTVGESGNVTMARCDSAQKAAQTWEVREKLLRLWDGRFSLVHQDTGKCLGLRRRGYTNGLPFVVSECTCSQQQLFDRSTLFSDA